MINQSILFAHTNAIRYLATPAPRGAHSSTRERRRRLALVVDASVRTRAHLSRARAAASDARTTRLPLARVGERGEAA